MTEPVIMPAVPKWLTLRKAATLTGRSKRTIRRWADDPANQIRERRDGGVRQIREEDLFRVLDQKDEYRESPTFGR